MKNVAVLGGGSFGTALALVLDTAGNNVRIWAREAEVVQGINENNRNPAYLSEVELPPKIKAYSNIEETIEGAEIVLLATPSHTVRDIAGKIKDLLRGDEIVVTVSKGIEVDTFLTMSQVLVQVLDGKILEDNIGVLYGPSHAEEVSKLRPTAIVASAYSQRTARTIQQAFITPMFRVYLNLDIIGVEIGGSIKNIMAIAAGIIDGISLGDNAKAALITRGLHEMKRMGAMLGAHSDTFSGLTGLGDLIVTCNSTHSRNWNVGYRVGKGEKLDDVVKSMNMVAEGIKTTKAVHNWAVKHNVDLPITSSVFKILFRDVDPKEVLFELMTRDPKDEILI